MTPETNPENNKVNFPLWQYLNQPVFSRQTQFILNPRRFAYMWRIELLKRCWHKECDAKGPQQH
jgi:hypothetical protein